MRALTFKGYLLSQLRVFSESHGSSFYTFAKAAKQNARLRQLLCLYIVLYADDVLKSNLIKRFEYLSDPCRKLNGLTTDNIGSVLAESTFSEYATVYRNYMYMHDRKCHEDTLKRLMHERIVAAQNTKHVTNYRIYTKLRLNHGNVNAFLKNGDISKVSLDTARAILTFINEQ